MKRIVNERQTIELLWNEGCLRCKKHKEPLFTKKLEVNPLFLFHMRTVHGASVATMIRHIAKMIFKNEEAQDEMIEKHKRAYGKHWI